MHLNLTKIQEINEDRQKNLLIDNPSVLNDPDSRELELRYEKIHCLINEMVGSINAGTIIF